MRETLRAWTEATETFVLEVIFEQRRGKRAAIVRTSLLALSKLYAIAIKARRILYDFRILRDSTLGIRDSQLCSPDSALGIWSVRASSGKYPVPFSSLSPFLLVSYFRCTAG